MTSEVVAIRRYPVKGLNAEELDTVDLTVGEGLPHDRRFAIAHGSTQFDAAMPHWLPKSNFLMLARDEKLAQLDATFEADSGVLTIKRSGKQVSRGNITDTTGRMLIGQFLSGFLAGSARGAPKIVESSDQMFSDVPQKCLSLVNLASVRDLERVVRSPVDPTRFRANIWIDGLPAWQELTWSGKEIGLGPIRLKVIDAIARCAATNVDPQTAKRDLNIPLALQRGFGHVNMGIYAEVIAPGALRLGEPLDPPSG